MKVALLSVHTSPFDQPGIGDAGGMNVYVLELSRRLAALGVDVDIITRGDRFSPSDYDVLHSHYWQSGVAAMGHGVPLVHSMHTMGAVKNLLLADGDVAESPDRIDAERAIVRVADRLMANTATEREQLIDLYGADPSRVHVVHPGVDTEVFTPTDKPRRDYVLYAGRLQALKGPDVLLRAAALLGNVDVVVVGGPSGPDDYDLTGLHDRVRFLPPMPQSALAAWLANAAIVAMPSHSESFGLVALEAQACGTPVVASRVGGLTTAVNDGVTGLLVDGHDPARWADALESLLSDTARLESMGDKAVAHAMAFSWDATADATLAVYRAAVENTR